jgi:hypothetical protein
MTKKIAATAMFALLLFPWAAQAQGFGNWWDPGFGDHPHGRVSAPEMPNYGMFAATLCGLAGYLVLRRRYAKAK